MQRVETNSTHKATDRPSSTADLSVVPASDDVAVSVIVPVYNEAAHIEGTLRSILANDGAASAEVIVVDGMSEDGTRRVVQRLAAQHANVRLLDNPHRTVPHAMNLAIRAAHGEILVRVDGHAEIAPDFLAMCRLELDAHPECACVGGAIEYVPEGTHAPAISMAMSSSFGVGNATFRLGGREGYVDTLAFGAYRKGALMEIGLFDEDLVRNQDDELNYRLIRSGHKIWLSKRIRSRYFGRSTFSKLYAQFYQYGYWKVFVNRKHKVVTTLRQLVPPSFVMGVGSLAVVPMFLPTTYWPLLIVVVAYLFAALWFGLRKTRRPRRLAEVMLAFATLHFAYGLGYLEGILHFNILRRSPIVRHTQITR